MITWANMKEVREILGPNVTTDKVINGAVVLHKLREHRAAWGEEIDFETAKFLLKNSYLDKI